MTGKLDKYKEKRDFEKTSEPEGIMNKSQEGLEESSREGLRFVVQHHLARRDHYDFRLEWDGVLLSWAVPKGPSYNTKDKRLAVQVEDHPLDYRHFEGIIPQGEYGGGVVMLWDEGYWEPLGDVDEGLQEGMLKFILKGIRLKGRWALVRLKKKAGEKQDNWLLLKEKDEYAQALDGIAEYTTSVRTGRTMEEIEAGEDKKLATNPFNSIEVQLAKLVSKVPEGEEWLFELKYDGYRIVAYMEENRVRLITRNGHDFTERFKEMADSLAAWANGRAIVVDGEMVITDAEGRTDFQALQNYLRNSRGKNLTYIIFDLLAFEGEDLRSRPLKERKELLAKLMTDAPSNLHYSRHVRGRGKESFAAACAQGMEGIIGKKADSLYNGGRSEDWIKLKCDRRQEFVIGGYTRSARRVSGISSLLLGIYEGNELVYAGRAGTGLTEKDMQELEIRFKDLQRENSPFKQAPKSRTGEKVIWLEPELVAEIKFAEWTEDNYLRQASFKGLRLDKNPREIRREVSEEMETQEMLAGGSSPRRQAASKAKNKAENEMEPSPRNPKGQERSKSMKNEIIIEGVKISNPDKVIFTEPEIRKEEVVRYYAQVAERMLPYVGQRILSIVRCPKGVVQTCFYKKHPGPGNPGIVTFPLVNSEGEPEEYFYIEDITGLVGEAQMGTLEFHIWGSRVDNLEKPDLMIFDLDPDEGMDLERVRQGVRDLKSILEQLSLKSYLKTSGGKGYHVAVPLKSAVSWEVFSDFAKKVAQVMEQQWPDRYTSNIRKASRINKIFIDWIRNARGATSIAPYSLRAKKGATVSMPISWDELDTVAPDGIDLRGALARLKKGDPWEDFFANEQRLK